MSDLFEYPLNENAISSSYSTEISIHVENDSLTASTVADCGMSNPYWISRVLYHEKRV